MGTGTSSSSPSPSSHSPEVPDDRSDPLDAFRQYRQSGDPHQYEALVCRYLPLVRKTARKYVRPGVALEDLVQVGTIGLMNAVSTFDPERGVKFETYAYHYIAGEIRHYLRDDADAVQAPRWVRKLYGELMAAIGALQQELGRTPTLREIAGRMNLTEAGVLEIMRAYDQARVLSLSDAQEGLEIRRDLIVRQRYVSFQLPVEDRIALMEAMERLSEVHRKVVYYLFYLDLTQNEAAKRLGISQRSVSRLLAAALKRMQTLLRTADAGSA